ncbi:MAG: caspase family protein [Candidatus Electryonea clarkiae]|nr:caspase family protein [Candidatus Electryonea clarkiae]MDP8288709.1 caspase family protein [Candidatus Electryonea clarkiae]
MKHKAIFFLTTILLTAIFTTFDVVANQTPEPHINATLYKTLKGHSYAIFSVSFSPDGSLLASGSYDKTIKLWRVSDGVLLRTLEGHSSVIRSVSFSPDGTMLTSGSYDNTVKLWRVSDGSLLRTLEGHSDVVGSVSFSPDGTMLTSGSFDNTVKLWRVSDGSLLRTLKGNSGDIYSVFFSPDGSLLASGSSDETVKLWRVSDGSLIRTLEGHSEQVNSVSFSPDGAMLTSGSSDNTVKLWRVSDGSLIRTLEGHSGDIYSVSFSPDGAMLISGSYPNTVKLWWVSDGSLIQTVKWHSSWVNSVSFSPDGTMQASGSNDKTVKLWCFGSLPLLTERQLALQAISDLFQPQDEFETETEYQARLSRGNEEKQAIEEKYTFQLEQLKQKMREKKEAESIRAENELQAQICQSLTEANLSIDSLGSYNADAEVFPVIVGVVSDKIVKISIPRNEARSFKENLQTVEVIGMKQFQRNLRDYDYFNIVIVHPITGSRYPFGEQRAVAGMAGVTVAVPGSQALIPPSLALTAMLSEPNGNGFLDAVENGKLIVEITNAGEGPAYGVIIDIKPETEDPDLTYSPTRIVGELPAGESRSLDFSLTAVKLIKRATRSFTITATETNGFVPTPAKLTFETYPLLLPKLELVDFGISTASGDNIIIPGEVFTVQARIQNRGDGSAKAVTFKANLPKNVYYAPESEQSYKFNRIEQGDYKDLEFSLLTSPQVADEVELTISINEANTQGKESVKLEINKPLQTIAEFKVKGVEQVTGAFADVATLTVDIAKDIPQTENDNSEAFAVVIGNRDYLKVQNVDYAINDAILMKEYLVKTLGFREENIFFVRNASKADFEGYFGSNDNYHGKLFNHVSPDGSSDVFVFYSGHGSPDVNSGKGYFVPVDCDPQYVALQGYSLDTFYKNLAKLPAKSMTIALDACFSGSGLLKNISPIGIKFDVAAAAIDNSFVYASSTGDQVSSWYPDKKHGMFTYYFLKAIHDQNGDSNADGKLTYGELFDYIADKNNGIPRQARKLHNVEQNPTFFGKVDEVFVEYK